MTETDVATARCPECSMPLTMHHDPGCSQPCGRCAAARPPAGKFRVTIRVERPDGQFVTSSREIPAGLMAEGVAGEELAYLAAGDIAGQFLGAYRRAAELAE